MDAWDSLLLLLYGIPPAIVLGTMCLVRFASLRMKRPITWTRAFLIGLLALPVAIVGYALARF